MKTQTGICCGQTGLFSRLVLIGRKLFNETNQMDVGPRCQIGIKIYTMQNNNKNILKNIAVLSPFYFHIYTEMQSGISKCLPMTNEILSL